MDTCIHEFLILQWKKGLARLLEGRLEITSSVSTATSKALLLPASTIAMMPVPSTIATMAIMSFKRRWVRGPSLLAIRAVQPLLQVRESLGCIQTQSTTIRPLLLHTCTRNEQFHTMSIETKQINTQYQKTCVILPKLLFHILCQLHICWETFTPETLKQTIHNKAAPSAGACMHAPAKPFKHDNLYSNNVIDIWKRQ